MKVATWNIRAWTAEKTPAVRDLLTTHDVVALSEIWNSPPDNPFQVISCIRPHSTNQRRRSGGVALVASRGTPMRPLSTFTHSRFQLLSASVYGCIVIAVYLSPRLSAADLDSLFHHLRLMARGRAIILGDFNARHSDWDSISNLHGQRLRAWADKSHFQLYKPPSSTFFTPSGSSTVDLALARTATLSEVVVLEHDSSLSDHAAVSATATLSTPRTVDRIPLTLIADRRVSGLARQVYGKSVPLSTTSLRQVTSPSSLDQAATRLARDTLCPWTSFRAPRPARFRPGWTRQLDNWAKERSRLLRAGNLPDARTLDKKIKREFRRNKRKLKAQLTDVLEENQPGQEARTLKSLLHVDSSTPTCDPDKFQDMMATLQDPTAAPMQLRSFQPPESFRTDIREAIKRDRPRKAFGPDLLRAEMLQLDAPIFSDAVFEMWKATGRTLYLPRLLRSGWYVPIPKGDTSKADDPATFRPICVTSIYRRVTSAALNTCLLRVYEPHHHQWGFRRGTNTECAITFATHHLRGRMTCAAILDVQRAYDTAPRDVLAAVLRKRIPSTLAEMLITLLTPMTVRTKGQSSAKGSLHTTLGVPQGDPTSPLIFNMFMDEFIYATRTIPRTVSSCFADDVLLLAEEESALQEVLDVGTTWAQENRMTWAVRKSAFISTSSAWSCSSSCPCSCDGSGSCSCPCLGPCSCSCSCSSTVGSVQLAGELLPRTKTCTYLGISLCAVGPAEQRIRKRISAASKLLSKIMRLTKSARLSHRQRRAIVQMFIFSRTDYVLYLQPLTPSVLRDFSNLERLVGCFVLGVSIPPNLIDRALLLSGLRPCRVRRMRYMAMAASRFATKASGASMTSQEYRAFKTMTQVDPLRSLLRKHSVFDDQDTQWVRTVVSQSLQEFLQSANRFARKIPQQKPLAPVFSTACSPTALKKATLWYLCRLSMNDETRPLNKDLQELLEKDTLTDSEEERIEELLSRFDLTRPRR